MNTSRLKQARIAAGKSLRDLSGFLASRGLSLTHAAIHKYEAGLSAPSPRTLLFIAEALNVAPAYFLREPRVEVRWLAFRRHARLTASALAQVQAVALRTVENQVHLQELLGAGDGCRFPRREAVETAEDAEAMAASVRRAWKLGEAPLESVTRTIEDRGGVVVEVETAKRGFDGLAGLANHRYPVFLVDKLAPPDRRRYTLARALAYLALDCDTLSDRVREALAHRFAAAFIVPAPVAFRELGDRRKHLDLGELLYLKLRYGLGIQAWMRRALDLGIVSPASYRRLCRELGAGKWRIEEPGAYEGEGGPSRLKQLLFRALSESLVSPLEAEAMLPGVTRKPTSASTPPRTNAGRLFRASAEERDRAMRRAAEEMQRDYEIGGDLRGFDAYGEKDLRDEPEGPSSA